jgi:hypothetical protein
MAPSNDAQIAVEQGMTIAEVNMAIGAIDRILKMVKDGKSNNRELTNARVELDHCAPAQSRSQNVKPTPANTARPSSR